MSRSLRLFLFAALAALCATAVVAAFRADAPARAAIVKAQGKGWKKTADYRFHSAVRKYGDWPWLMLAGTAGAALSWKLNRRRWTRILVAAMIASTLAGLLANASRLTTGRTRPRASPEVAQGFYGPWHEGKLLVGDSKHNSFPSGHTATAFGFAVPIVLAAPSAGLLALAGAALIAWSSIMMGAHHPSDVVVSIILSSVVGWLVWRWIRDHGDAALAQFVSRLRALRKK